MSKSALFGMALGLSTLSFLGVPALAQAPQSAQNSASRAATIPESSAVAVEFPASVTLDLSQGAAQPMTLFLSQPLLDSNGNVVAPENTPVSVQIKPVPGGAQIVAESVVIRGRVVPIQASSPVIPANVTGRRAANVEARQAGSAASGAVGSVFGYYSGPGIAARAANASVSDSERVQMVEIARGSAHILTLRAPVTVPATPTQTP